MQGYRFRLYPNAERAQALLRWIGCQRWIYNAKCSEDRYFRTFARKSLQHTGQHPPVDGTYSHFITEETQWLREVPSQVLRNGAASWVMAYSRFFKKLSGRPTFKGRRGEQGLWLTSELFCVEKDETGHRLLVGTKKFPIGAIAFTPNAGPKGPNGKRQRLSFDAPASIHIKLDAGRWYVSFSNESDVPEANDEDTAAWLATLGGEELTGRAVGIDRGVALPLQCSNGTGFDLSKTQRDRIARKQAAAKRWQKKLSRRAKGGANRRKAAQRIARLRRYEADVRRDFAHQTSHAIVADARTSLIVFEALDVQRMTRKPKPRQNEHGHWARNGARAKAGLTRSILGSAWSKTREYCTYKARRAGKLVLDVPAHYTSQACSHCGYTHPGNRPCQAVFVCQRCGHSENADLNASRNIRNRGVERLLSGEFRPKEAKRIRRMRQKTTVGAGRPESKSVETMVSRRAGSSAAHRSRKQKGDGAILAETHASRTIGA